MQEYRWDAKISELLNEIKTVKSYLEVQEEKINEVGLPLLHKSSFSSNGEDAKVQLTLLEQAKPVAAPGKGKEKSKGFKNKNRKLVKFTPQEKQFQEINRNEIIKLKELLEGEEDDLNSASKINKKIEAALKQSSQVIGEASALLGNKVHHPPGYETVVTKVLNEKQLLVPGLKMKPIVKIPEPMPIVYDFDARIERPSQKEYPSYAQRYFPEDNNPLLSTLDECKRAEDTIQRLLHTTLSPSSKLNAPALPRQRSYVMEDDRLLHPIHRNSNPEQISMFPSSSHKSSSKLPLIEDQNFNIKGSNDSAEKGDSFLKDIERITALIHQQEKTLQDSLLFEESRTPVPITNHKTTFIKENAFKTPEKLPPINLNSSSPPEDSLISGTTMKEENSTSSQKDSTSLSREIDELIARTMDLSKDMQLSVERELLSTKEKESTTPTKIITASPAQIKESGENTFTITLTIPATATTANITLPPFPTTPAVFAAQPTSQTPTQQTPTQSSLQPEKVNTEEEKALQNKTAERARPPPLQRSPSARAAAEFTAQIFQTVIPLAEKSKEAPTSDIPFSSQVDNIIEKDKENDLLKDIEKVRRRMSALERNIDKEPVNDTEKEPKDASGELSQPQVVPSSAELISNSVYNRNQSNPTSVQPNASSLPVTHNNNNNQAPNSLPSQQGPAGYVQNPPHLATDNSIHHNGLFPIALPNPATIHQLNQVVQPPITLSTPDPAKLYNNNPPIPLSPQPTTQHYIQTANGVFIPSPYPHNHAMGNAFFPIHQQMVPQNGNLSNHPGWPQVPPSHPQPPISRKDHQMQQSPRQDLTRKYSNKVLHSIPEKAVYQGSPTKGKLHKQFSKTQVLDPSLNDEKVPQSDKKKKRKNGVKKKRKKQSRVRKQKYIGQSLHDEDEEERESVAIKDTKASEMRKLHTKKLLEEREKRRREQSEDDMKYKIEHREDYSDLSDEDEEDEDPREYEEDEEGRYYYYEDEHDPDGYEEYDNRSTSSRSYSSSSMSRLASVASGISMGSRLSVDEEDIEAKRQSSIDTYRALRQLRQQENERERMELYYAQNQVFR